MTERNYLKLSEFCSVVDGLVTRTFTEKYNVLADIIKVSTYPTQIYITMYQEVKGFYKTEKYQFTGIIWSQELDGIMTKLKSAGLELTEGLQAVFTGIITFHKKNGLGLRIYDVDIQSTIGEYELKKREIRNKLTVEKIIDLNQSLPLPFFIKNIAVICSKSSDGLSDFNRLLSENEEYVKLNITYFYSLVQGISAQQELLKNFNLVKNRHQDFDIVILIRGGGSNTDLTVFNDYDLAKTICNFPIPVLTGIGHSTNKNILDEVAHKYFDTPSKLAQYLNHLGKTLHDKLVSLKDSVFKYAINIVDKKNQGIIGYKNSIMNSKQLISDKKHVNNEYMKTIFKTKIKLTDKRQEVNQTFNDVKYNLKHYTGKKINELSTQIQKIKNISSIILTTKDSSINHTYEKITLISPKKTLERGYSLTFFNNKVMKDTTNLKNDDIITTELHDGVIVSKISNIKKEK